MQVLINPESGTAKAEEGIEDGSEPNIRPMTSKRTAVTGAPFHTETWFFSHKNLTMKGFACLRFAITLRGRGRFFEIWSFFYAHKPLFIATF